MGWRRNGLHGSKNYVKNHFTDTVTKKFNAAGDKLSVYLNLDNGTGKIRGIYLQGNAAVKPIFKQWFQPFHDLGASTLTLQNTGGTDHLSFDAIGIACIPVYSGSDGIRHREPITAIWTVMIILAGRFETGSNYYCRFCL